MVSNFGVYRFDTVFVSRSLARNRLKPTKSARPSGYAPARTGTTRIVSNNLSGRLDRGIALERVGGDELLDLGVDLRRRGFKDPRKDMRRAGHDLDAVELAGVGPDCRHERASDRGHGRQPGTRRGSHEHQSR